MGECDPAPGVHAIECVCYGLGMLWGAVSGRSHAGILGAMRIA